jgi:hypothetical protein
VYFDVPSTIYLILSEVEGRTMLMQVLTILANPGSGVRLTRRLRGA